MKMNKKYSIRKLTVGIASISIGLFVANSIDLQQLANVNLANNIIKAEGTDVKKLATRREFDSTGRRWSSLGAI